jgi:hypothetical protein
MFHCVIYYFFLNASFALCIPAEVIDIDRMLRENNISQYRAFSQGILYVRQQYIRS